MPASLEIMDAVSTNAPDSAPLPTAQMAIPDSHTRSDLLHAHASPTPENLDSPRCPSVAPMYSRKTQPTLLCRYPFVPQSVSPSECQSLLLTVSVALQPPPAI